MNFNFKLKFNALSFLIIVNAVIFLVALLVQSKISLDYRFSEFFGAEIVGNIYNGNLWLLLTACFLHFNAIHFLLNMFSLYKIGTIVEEYYGSKKLFIVYIIGGLGGSILSYITAIIFGRDYFYYSLGASGAIMALLGLILGGTLRKYRYGVELPLNLTDILIILLNVFLIGLLPGVNIDNWAHLGGVITGIIFGFVFIQTIGNISNKFDKIIEKTFLTIAILIFISSYILLFINDYNLIFK